MFEHEGFFMTIKKRLILSYLAMLFVPFMLIAIAGGIIRSLDSSLRNGNSGPFLGKDLSRYLKIDDFLLSRINQIILDSPGLLLSGDFLSELQTDTSVPGFFAVIQDEIIRYKPSEITPDILIEAIRPGDQGPKYRSLHRHMKPEILFRWEFNVPGQSNATLYYFTNPEQAFSRYFSSGILFVLGAVLVLVITNGTLTYIVSRSIISPLKMLENAAGRIRDGDLNGPVTRKSDDEMTTVFSSFNEMRERLKDSLEKQLSYEENRKELIASISHDLRTPLTVLKGYVEGLKDGVAKTEEKRNHYLDTIHHKARQMDRLIDDLFLFSRLETDKYPYESVSMELSGWLADAVKDLSVDYSGMRFQSSLAESVRICADPPQLYRVLSNIVQNSYHYAGRKDITVTVKLRIIENKAEITIADNGRGIPEQRLPLIFQRFYRGDDSRNQNSGGSGLGLSIAGMIIIQHKGTIRAESPPGKGLSIIITLPLRSPENKTVENNR